VNFARTPTPSTAPLLHRVPPCGSDDFDFQRWTLPGTQALTSALRGLAHEAAPALGADVVQMRLRRYEWAVGARRAGRTRAFMLGQTRRLGDETFHYFGPLYSTEGAFLPLFAHAMRTVCEGATPWWLVAEIERPRLRAIFAHLVPTSWPREAESTPPRFIAAVRGLASSLGHIEGLDGSTLRTTCSGSPAQLVVAHAETARDAYTMAAHLDAALATLRASARHGNRGRLS
jgi:hypothetical protein